nr:hypothetical protein [Tanacetum cinerariifolium]
SVIVLGDESGYEIGDVQKTKLAAIEAEWETEPAPAAFTLFDPHRLQRRKERPGLRPVAEEVHRQGGGRQRATDSSGRAGFHSSRRLDLLDLPRDGAQRRVDAAVVCLCLLGLGAQE